MVTKFEQAMVKLATVAQDPNRLVDCSEVIPVPKAVKLPAPTLPAGKSLANIQAAVRLSSSLCSPPTFPIGFHLDVSAVRRSL